MLDFFVFKMARERAAELTRSALPDSPVHSDAGGSRPDNPGLALRHRVSVALRRLADRLEPVPNGHAAAAADCG